MVDKVKCPNCGKNVEDFVVYCSYCGEVLKKEKKKSSSIKIDSKTGEIISTTPETITIKVKDGQKRTSDWPWYKPLKRKRPWYHPIEWLFWIGWSIYVVFRFLAVETFRYLKWCVCWGRPEESKK